MEQRARRLCLSVSLSACLLWPFAVSGEKLENRIDPSDVEIAVVAHSYRIDCRFWPSDKVRLMRKQSKG
jgi:hypothetical protein